MEPTKFNENICRICLEDNVTLNWNEEMYELCGISYRDCYYKYTKLLPDDSDSLPKKLCATCSIGLKNAHLLFEKASESFKFLLDALCPIKNEADIEIGRNQPAMKFEIMIFDEKLDEEILTDDKTLIDIEEETLGPTNEYDYERLRVVNTDNTDNNSISKEIPMSEDETNENGNLLRSETPPDQELSQSSDTKPAASSTTSKRKKKFLCSYCSLVVSDKSYLKVHEATHNANRKRTETCPQCGLKFYTKMTLRNHMMVHEEKREKKYKCEFCDKAFYNRGGLNIHRRIHLGQMVACQLCPKEFYRQIDLDKHLATHSTAPLHKKFEESKYNVKCQYCNETVASKNWRTHKAIHLNQPAVKCKVCSKEFFARSRLVQHLRRLHGKTAANYEEFIIYLKSNERMSHLMIKQQQIVIPVQNIVS